MGSALSRWAIGKPSLAGLWGRPPSHTRLGYTVSSLRGPLRELWSRTQGPWKVTIFHIFASEASGRGLSREEHPDTFPHFDSAPRSFHSEPSPSPTPRLSKMASSTVRGSPHPPLHPMAQTERALSAGVQSLSLSSSIHKWLRLNSFLAAGGCHWLLWYLPLGSLS